MSSNVMTNAASPESSWVPFVTTSLTGRRVLVLAPHPDDETFACGGALLLHCRQQDPVKVVVLTDGALADNPGALSGEDYARVRESEANRAITALGVSEVEFWRLPDRGLAATDALVQRLVDTIEACRPDLIYAPSPLEFHPDHRATAELLWQAVSHTSLACDVAFYEYNRPLSVNALVDITDVADTKRAACRTYESQIAIYPYDECALGLNRYRALTVSPACTYAEGFCMLSAATIRQHPIDYFAWAQVLPRTRRPTAAVPLVTVVVRTKDRPALLREALASVAAQSYPNIEIVVVNDGGQSVDDVLAGFVELANVRCIAHPVSRGRAAAANSGLRDAAGKYLCFLDDDDLLYAHHVQKMVGFLEQTGEQMAYSDCERVEFRWDGDAFTPTEAPRRFLGGAYDRERLRTTNYIPIMTAMFTRDLREQVGECDESLEWLEDWDWWLRMSAHAAFHHLPGVSAKYRTFASHDGVYESCYETVRSRYAVSAAPARPSGPSADRSRQLRADVNRLRGELASKQSECESLTAQVKLLENSQALRLSRRLRDFVPLALRQWLRQAR